jgi:hypothetical protein
MKKTTTSIYICKHTQTQHTAGVVVLDRSVSFNSLVKKILKKKHEMRQALARWPFLLRGSFDKLLENNMCWIRAFKIVVE